MSQRLLLGLPAVVAMSALVTAQQAGSIRGTVIDKDFEAPLPGAVVQIVETGQRVETNDQGNFVFADVRPGRYTLIVGKDGYVRQVVPDVIVSAGQLTDRRVELVGEFTDLEEFVVQETLQFGSSTEQDLIDLRIDSPTMLDSIGSELMSRSGTSDAADALRLVAGASTANGRSAVIRGLPDRYVVSSMNGVLLPSSDEEKRAVELDVFPTEVIDNLQVSKTFTPDQIGNASGGAVNLLLKGVPEEPLFLKYKAGTTYNTNFTGRGDFLGYEGGGVRAFGKDGGDFAVQELGENWTGAVGAEPIEAPLNYKFATSAGGRIDLGDGWRLGGFANFFYDRDNASFQNGRDDTWVIVEPFEPMTPQFSQGTPQDLSFTTALLDIAQSSQSVQYGGLGTIGIANDDNALTLAYLFTRTDEETVTFAEDTRGKEYFFPGHDPNDPLSPGFDDFQAAPWLRQQTIAYVARSTETLQLNGRHRLDLYNAGPFRGVELDWTVSRSSAERDEPDRRQFGAAWYPVSGLFVPFKPAAQFVLGNLQRIFEKTTEDSENLTANVKLPFEVWNGRKGYVKFGVFHDEVQREFNQDTYSNFLDNSTFASDWDGLDWTRAWQFQDHPISNLPLNAPDPRDGFDIDYRGEQTISASYLMLDLPLLEDLRAIGGIRFESTEISIVNDPENQALWIPPGTFAIAEVRDSDPALYNADISQRDELPSLAFVYTPTDELTFRASYAETIARQTFRELTPTFQQEFLGGPIFIGNPQLRISEVRNYDLRVDYQPTRGSLLSVSYFRKDIKDPIEYVEQVANFVFTTAANFPRGKLTGWELEARQDFGAISETLSGLTLGGNATWIDTEVRLRDPDILLFEQVWGVRQQSTRDMTDAPDYLLNLFGTYEFAPTDTILGLFYTVTGDTLIQAPGPSGIVTFTPATYDTRWVNVNATLTQRLGKNVALTFAAKNLTDAVRRQVYRSEFLEDDVLRREFTTGIEYSLSIGGEIRF